MFALFVAANAAQAGQALDALRSANVVATASVVASTTASAQAAAAVSQQSQQRMTQALRAIKAAQGVQSDLRNQAYQAISSVPDGLTPGGLNPGGGAAIVADGSRIDLSAATNDAWQGISSVNQTAAGDQTTVTVKQNQAKALATWTTFNVGKKTTLYFDQSGGTTSSGSNDWLVLNRVLDPSAAPSQIMGSIRAEGGVLVINQNGIIFGGTSQVNVHTLIASGLDITNTMFANGLAAPSTIFSCSATPCGIVSSDAGARLSSDSDGRILLLGGEVHHAGAISSPSGQALLAAGTAVSLSSSDDVIGYAVTATSGSQPTGSTTGTVVNTGIIDVPTGNINLTGRYIEQRGVLKSSTSTSRRGSIILNAAEQTLNGWLDSSRNAFVDGSVLFAAGSLTQILPDSTDAAKITDDQVGYNSALVVIGGTITVQGKTASTDGAFIQVKGYDALSKGKDNFSWTDTNRANEGNPTTVEFKSGRVFLGDGSLIDVSGTTGAVVSASRNSIEMQLLASELADSPVLKDSPLYKGTIYFDASASGTTADGTSWVGTPLVPQSVVNKWIALKTERSLEERMASAGGIAVNSIMTSGGGPDFISQAGATIDLSGGFVTYQPGFVKVTQLTTAGGQTVSVSSSKATGDIAYKGIANSTVAKSHSKWGVTETWSSPMGLVSTGYQSSDYVEGHNAGTLVLDVGTLIPGATIDAATVSGITQRTLAMAPKGAVLKIGYPVAPSTVTAFDHIPGAGSLSRIDVGADAADIDLSSILGGDRLAPKVFVNVGGVDVLTNPVKDTNGNDLSRTAQLPAAWLAAGFSTYELNAQDEISVANGVRLDAGVGGSVALTADRIDIAGSVTAHGGTITLSAPRLGNSGAPAINLAATASLDVSGLWTNDAVSGPVAPVIAVNGGTVTLSSEGDIDLAAGSLIDVSAGGAVNTGGKASLGNAGAISLSVDAKRWYDNYADADGKSAAYLNLGGQLRGYGLSAGGKATKGGSLTVSVPWTTITVRSAAEMNGLLLSQTDSSGTADPSQLTLSSDFFSANGFESISLAGRHFTVKGGTGGRTNDISAQAAVRYLSNPTAITGASDLAASRLASDFATVGLLRPSKLSFQAKGDSVTTAAAVADLSEALVVEDNAAIHVGAQGSISLTASQLVIVDGTLDAPAGTITVNGGAANQNAASNQGVWIGSTGRLLARGTTTRERLSDGTIFTDVLAGGTVTLNSLDSSSGQWIDRGGYVVLAPGSLVDVSGTTGPSSLAAAGSSTAGAVVGSAGGSITVRARLGAALEGDAGTDPSGAPCVQCGLLAKGGGGAAGGVLNLVEGYDGPTFAQTSARITLRSHTTNLVSANRLSAGSRLDSALDPSGNIQFSISADSLAKGGFNSLSASFITVLSPGSMSLPRGLAPTVELEDRLALVLPGSFTAYASTLSYLAQGDGHDTGKASINAGYIQWNGSEANPAQASLGAGNVTLSAQLIDLVGDLALQNISKATFEAASDIRLSGEVQTDSASGTRYYGGRLNAASSVTFRAAQIYPTTGSSYTINGGTLDANGTVRFESNGNPASTPYSAGGSLYVYAPVIEQAGVVRAPLGTLALGCSSDCPSYATPTASLTLEPGSLTSVALAGGQIVPYGAIESSDGSWVFPIYDGTSGTAVYDSVKSAPPAKVIKLGGTGIDVKGGAVLDGSGGGELYGWEWVPGTGGSKDVFASTVGNSLPVLARYLDGLSSAFAATTAYAILPGYTSKVGIVDPVNSSLTPDVGKQITISGVSGLANGTYTLLPARYAVLPGAYLVSVQTKPGSASVLATSTPQPAFRQADGAYLTSGYLSTPFNGGSDEHWSIIRVTPGVSARRYSEIADSYATSFYAKMAAQNKTVVPRLAGDAGQMILEATNRLLFSGTGKFDVAQGGRGGMIDIAGDQIAVVTSTDRDAGYVPAAPTGYTDAWNPIVLAAGDLDKMGAESLLLGGTRVTAGDGVHVIATASGVVVDNKGSDGNAEALTLADVMLVAAPKAVAGTTISVGGLSIPIETPSAGGGIVQVRDGSIIDATGKVVAGGLEPIYLDGGAEHIFPTITKTTITTNGVKTEYDYYTQQQIQDYYRSARLSQGGFVRVSNGGYAATNRLSAYGTLPSGAITIGVWNGNTLTAPTLYAGTIPLPGYATYGAAVVGDASLKSEGLIALSAVQDTRLSPQATIRAKALDLMSSAIHLGTSDASKPGLVLSQAMLDSLTGINALVLKSAGNITFYSALEIGNHATDGSVLDAAGQPLLATLVLDAAGIEAAPGAGAISLTARQISLRNSLGGSAPAALDQISGATLSIEARDVLGEVPDGIVNTGSAKLNASKVAFGAGTVGIAGFSSVTMKSSGVIAFEANGGKLTVQSALTLDAPMIAGGTLDTSGSLPKFNQASYSVTASDMKATPGYYRVSFTNSATSSALALPVALLGNSLNVTAGDVAIDTRIALPGGVFKATAKNGDVILGDHAVIDVGGAAVVFRDAIATSGGGTVVLVSETGDVSIGSSARINVGTVVRDASGAIVSTLTDAEAGTLILSAANGTASVAGHLSGEGSSADKGGTISVDARTIDTDGIANGNDYDGLATKLGAAGFTKSWTIRARAGNIAIGGAGTAANLAVSKVRDLTVSADAGDITLSQYGKVDATGLTGGKVALWAGRNLSVSGIVDAHGAVADSAGKGGQVTLAAGTTDTSGALSVASGAFIDVSAHQAANTTDNTKATVLAATDDTGTITLQAPRTASGLDLNITDLHGTLKGAAEIVVVGNKVYGGVSTLTPTAMNTTLAEANTFMGGTDSTNEHTIKARLASIGLNAAYLNTSLHIRPGIEIRNSGDITVTGDSLNPAGIDLSGTWYTGAADTAYYTVADYARHQGYNVSGALKGHFGEREEPVVLTIRAGGNLNFGTCAAGCTSAAQLTVGSLSDGFSASGLTSYGYRGTSASTVTVGTGAKTFTTQAGLGLAANQAVTAVSADGTLALMGTVTSYNNATGALTINVPSASTSSTPSYIGILNASNARSWLIYASVTDAGASGQATLFAAPDRAGTDAPDSATFRLVAGADPTAANALAVARAAAGSVVVAGLPSAKPTLFLINGALNDSGKGGTANPTQDVNLSYLIQASLVRTGTGDIDIAAAGDLVLQGAQSVVYTAGTARNVSGSSAQPLAGFTQYSGQLKVQMSTTNLSATQYAKMLLPQVAFGVRGGDVDIGVEGNVIGANGAGYTYELLGMGSQNKLTSQNTSNPGFDLTYMTSSRTSGQYSLATFNGYRQLAWYALPEYFAEGIGALGGGDLSIRAGGSVSNVVLALPTNARDAGATLAASVYDAVSQTGLYVQGGGSLSVKAGGDVTGVNSYVQSGSTMIAAAGSIKPNAIVTGTGDVALSAGGDIVLADYTINNAHVSQFTVSGLSIAQNSSMLGAVRTNYGTTTGSNPNSSTYFNSYYYMVDVTDTLQGMATSVPDGMVSLSAIGSITLSTGEIATNANRATKWSNIQGILPAGFRAVSLQGDIVNNKRFVTWPSASGTVDIVARGSVTLNNGFTLSDAQRTIMPTLTNTLNAMIAAGATATNYVLPTYVSTGPSRVGGAVYTAGGDAKYTYLEKENYATAAVDLTASDKLVLHEDGLHDGQSDPVRVYALTGDIVQATERELGDLSNVTYEVLAKASSFYAGRDIVGLILLGQNNLAQDVTSIVAGRDVIYQPERDPISGLITAGYSLQQIAAIRLAGPGELFVAAGRDVNLGMSQGLVTIGNVLNPNLPSQTKGSGQGASITVMAGTDIDTLNYAAFFDAFVVSASSSTNLYREGLTLVDSSGASLSGDVSAWLSELGESKRDILLNRVFFDLVRDSGREHTNAATRDNYQAGYDAVDTVTTSNAAYANYQRAYAAIASLLGGTSGAGDFKGVFSRVRTTAGGDITIIAPNGTISVGAAALPTGFNYGGSTASSYGVVTEQGGSVRMYADQDILVNQSRIFTLNGGDITLVSRHGNIDAGKGAKTVQSIQPATVSYDVDGFVTITPIGASSGSGIAVLRSLPTTPEGNADLIAFEGAVDAGDAGIRVSGNLNIAATQVLNAFNINVGGAATGVPVVAATTVNLGALGATDAAGQSSGAADAAARSSRQAGSRTSDMPSIITVEVIGYGGGDGSVSSQQQRQGEEHQRQLRDRHSYNPEGNVQVLGYATLSDSQMSGLTEEEKRAIRN